MSTSPASPELQEAEAGEATLFDSLARLVPPELQTAYYRVLAHTRTLGPDDEMLRILEAMGTGTAVSVTLAPLIVVGSGLGAAAYGLYWLGSAVTSRRMKRSA